jgi:hypothetical protein
MASLYHSKPKRRAAARSRAPSGARRLLGVEVVPDVGGGAGVGDHEVDDKAAGAGGDVGVDTARATGAGGDCVGRGDYRVRGGAIRGRERDGTLRAAGVAGQNVPVDRQRTVKRPRLDRQVT